MFSLRESLKAIPKVVNIVLSSCRNASSITHQTSPTNPSSKISSEHFRPTILEFRFCVSDPCSIFTSLFHCRRYKKDLKKRRSGTNQSPSNACPKYASFSNPASERKRNLLPVLNNERLFMRWNGCTIPEIPYTGQKCRRNLCWAVSRVLCDARILDQCAELSVCFCGSKGNTQRSLAGTR